MGKLANKALMVFALALLAAYPVMAVVYNRTAHAKPPRKHAAKVLVCLSADDIRSVEMAYRNSRRGDGTRGLPEGYRAIELDREDAVCLLSKLVGALHGNPPTPRVTFPH